MSVDRLPDRCPRDTQRPFGPPPRCRFHVDGTAHRVALYGRL